MSSFSGVRIVGSGLIGTSIALGLAKSSIPVDLVDSDSRSENLANDLAMGEKVVDPELVIFSLPSQHLSMVIDREYALNPKSTFIDIGSVKTNPLVAIRSSKLPLAQFVASHPMAGREIGGPESARGDLFEGRSWVLTPQGSSPKSIEQTRKLVTLLGATPIEMDPLEHDKAVAAISHLPQILASLLAKQLQDFPDEWLALAGQGLRDTVRIAGSDPKLWQEIISMNREKIAPLLHALIDDLQSFEKLLSSDGDNSAAIGALIEEGRTGRAKIPGKHGGKARNYSYLPIVIPDAPGNLAAIFNICAEIDVNVEDLSIEHSPGQLTGLITLGLSEQGAQKLSQHLITQGWNVHPVRK
jgi:prephenate dehydrogenase